MISNSRFRIRDGGIESEISNPPSRIRHLESVISAVSYGRCNASFSGILPESRIFGAEASTPCYDSGLMRRRHIGSAPKSRQSDASSRAARYQRNLESEISNPKFEILRCIWHFGCEVHDPSRLTRIRTLRAPRSAAARKAASASSRSNSAPISGRTSI